MFRLESSVKVKVYHSLIKDFMYFVFLVIMIINKVKSITKYTKCFTLHFIQYPLNQKGLSDVKWFETLSFHPY